MENRSLAGRLRLLALKTPILHRLNSPVLGTKADEKPERTPVAFGREDGILAAVRRNAEKPHPAALPFPRLYAFFGRKAS
jgi:hypothetical protein